MSHSPAYINQAPLHSHSANPHGFLTSYEGENMYGIEAYHQMPPFFMSISSSSDLWMYLSSKGSLTAGRQNYNNALFPYYTDDRIHQSAEITGPKTFIRLKTNQGLVLWEPFSDYYRGLYKIRRFLYKNISGTKVIFREINEDLMLEFQYSWMSSDSLGWIRKCTLKNLAKTTRELDLTDGLQDILPFGVTRDTQSTLSTLMDAYKVCEWLEEEQLGLFRMSSIPVDRAEPSEALRTNVVWCAGLQVQKVLLSTRQFEAIRDGLALSPEYESFGQKAAFLLHQSLILEAQAEKHWYLVADVAKDSSDVVALQQLIRQEQALESHIEAQATQSTQRLNGLVSLADGIQKTGDPLNDRRHFANVMFNIMRGGIFEHNDQINRDDFLRHLAESNKPLYEQFQSLVGQLPPSLSLKMLHQMAREQNNHDLLRLALEYLPLSFSRRHGDPSRPWNFFDIRVKNPDGTDSLNYQGNWRDIFQNWEALACAFPAFLPGMICRFLNASTADGYNPYRITREGFDWEVPEPDNPWAYIGYWGDHQIIYLLKLMELHEQFFPGKLLQQFQNPVFTYASVPYRIKSYPEILKNPQDTILFDHQAHEALMELYRAKGADGKLMQDNTTKLVRAGFTEKILVSLLTKLSNFVPQAGIWLNTQRPEWNDANNALVGNGASMVTLYHMRRYVKFLQQVLGPHQAPTHRVSTEVAEFFQAISHTLKSSAPLLAHDISPGDRKHITDQLGMAGDSYRNRVYQGFSAQSTELNQAHLLEFLELSLAHIDHSIAANQREDGLYHAYNLIAITPEAIHIQHLDLMLEGQVAVLNSGLLDATQTTELTRRLFESPLWREDQQSFMLYPFKRLPTFLQKNIIPSSLVAQSHLLQQLLQKADNSIIRQDAEGIYHFHPELRNAAMLRNKLRDLQPAPTEQEHQQVLDIYEQVFHHRAFTGRSGSFYKYEGLGSIYWHMVSKLLLALGESILQFAHEQADPELLSRLKNQYYKVRKGIGAHKQPLGYGAFPSDPYSHTPLMMGVQQPGMTGQVKEDILSRYKELGVDIQKGKIRFIPVLLHDQDFAELDTIHFSLCHTPVSLTRGQATEIKIYTRELPEPIELHTPEIPEQLAAEIFNRSGQVTKVEVCIPQ